MHSGHMLRDGTWPDHVRVNMASRQCPPDRLFAASWKLRRNSPTHTMATRVRHCIECPKCLTRYLPSFSPYRNGSYLMSLSESADEWTLYCACGRPHISSRWSWSDLKQYAVSNQAHDRGYGPPEEIVPVDKKSVFSHLRRSR